MKFKRMGAGPGKSEVPEGGGKSRRSWVWDNQVGPKWWVSWKSNDEVLVIDTRGGASGQGAGPLTVSFPTFPHPLLFAV